MRTSLHKFLVTGLVTSALLGAFAAMPAYADTMRCGNRLVSEGDTRSQVLQLCGEPTEVTTRSILRRPTVRLNGRLYFNGDGFEELPVEIWTYNFGPYQLMRRVKFVDGLIEQIETLGHGFIDSSKP